MDKYSLPKHVEVILITIGSVVGLAEIISREPRRKYRFTYKYYRYSLISCDNEG